MRMQESVESAEEFEASQVVVPRWMQEVADQARAEQRQVRVVRRSVMAMSFVVSAEVAR